MHEESHTESLVDLRSDPQSTVFTGTLEPWANPLPSPSLTPCPSSSAFPPPRNPATFIPVPNTPHCLHPGGGGVPAPLNLDPEGCREPRRHSEWRAGREELGCHFFLVKRKGKGSGGGGRWERGKGKNLRQDFRCPIAPEL